MTSDKAALTMRPQRTVSGQRSSQFGFSGTDPAADTISSVASFCLAPASESFASSASISGRSSSLARSLVKVGRMEAAERRASGAHEKIIALQEELSRLQKIEAKFAAQEKLIRNLEEQSTSFKSLVAQNGDLTKRMEVQTSELTQAQIKIAKLEAKLEVLTKK